MSEQEAPGSAFGQRHPMLITLAIVFVAGFLFGGLQGGVGFLLGALLGGVGGVVLFFLLSGILAFIITIVQAVSRVVRRSPSATGEAENSSFGRRFMRNLEGATDFWIQGWH